MSKIFDVNWLKEASAIFWKRCAEWATVLLNKYRYDPFFRTETNVLALQGAFALVILGLVGTSFTLLYHDISTAIISGIRAGIAENTPLALGPAIVSEIQHIKSQNLLIIASVIILTTILFGYIIARITLTPARNALAAQKQFIGNVAHELRTPLAVIKTNTEVTLMDKNILGDLRETLSSNIEELDRISHIINNLLSISTLVRPEKMEFAPVDLSIITQEVIKGFAKLAHTNDQEMIVRSTPRTFVWGNASALTQIVSNVVKNALNYSPKGSSVRVTVEPMPNDRVQLTVKDSGIGIARKDLFRIFEPFYRAEASRTKGAGGSGLGLTIVSELVKMHQGRITIRSAIGKGTAVAVSLPGIENHRGTDTEQELNSLHEVAVDFSKQ